MTEHTSLALPQGATSIEGLLLAAVEHGATVDQLERLMELRRQLQAEASKRAYDEAMARFQQACPAIVKDKPVLDKYGKLRYHYAPLDKIVSQVKALIGDCGFSYAIDSIQEPGIVGAICVVKHAAGHSEDSRFAVPIQTDAYMSEPQKYASALTFAKRYAFCNAFGIMTADEDDDNASDRPDVAAMAEDGARYSTPEERREQRQQQEKATLAAKGETKKDCKLTMLGRGETVIGQQGRKDHVGFWVVVRSAEKFIRYYSPQQFGERVKLAGDPDNVLTPHKHCGPIICDLTAEADGSGGYNYVASNLRVLPVEGRDVPPIEPEVLTVHDLDEAGTLETLGGKSK